ncbi:hypothetical protein BOTBODRAFT_175417 [Botryobasidium botryosum FD-172 SS1]|uniref:GP-PDE domain-containing protein n=1 Tax=Botryobasidium botryosum (strain FD-172 SS1) TaxID=930990 RepID=A0A067MPA0_BOTB1|nr:hypothetical protein BOTBODRAFT_175417 [Botryobasidium botryosum FD-172 SS1]
MLPLAYGSASVLLLFGALISTAVAVPTPLVADVDAALSKYYDIQGHRGSRGHAVESTLPSFAWGLISGVRTLEMDNGITKDGAVIVWHDEDISSTKCQDTKPVTPKDPLFPYVGKFVANLTLAQIKTLDCGSRRLDGFPLQLSYPGTRISTLNELFSFLDCADPNHAIELNIESKINPVQINQTRSVDTFVTSQQKLFSKSAYYDKITYQSFDWRTLVAMKKLDKKIKLSALVDSTTLYGDDGKSTSLWLAGLRPDSFPAPTVGEQLVLAANSIGASIISPAALYEGSAALPTLPGYKPFTTKAMVDQAHKIGISVKPWTINALSVVDQLVGWGVDGIITDYPTEVARWGQQKNLAVPPPYAADKILKCLAKFNQVS